MSTPGLMGYRYRQIDSPATLELFIYRVHERAHLGQELFFLFFCHTKFTIKRAFLLKGLIRCSDCGAWMTPHCTQKENKDGSTYRICYYRCTKTMHFENSACSVKHINAEYVEGLVVGKLSELSQNDVYLRTSIEELNRDLQRKVEPLEREALNSAVRSANRYPGNGQESTANRAVRIRTQNQRDRDA
jgi:hypothetical protein